MAINAHVFLKGYSRLLVEVAYFLGLSKRQLCYLVAVAEPVIFFAPAWYQESLELLLFVSSQIALFLLIARRYARSCPESASSPQQHPVKMGRAILVLHFGSISMLLAYPSVLPLWLVLLCKLLSPPLLFFYICFEDDDKGKKIRFRELVEKAISRVRIGFLPSPSPAPQAG